MIFDTLDHLDRYRAWNANFATAADFIKSHDLSALPDGRTEIDGDNVFVNAMDADLKPAEEARFEFHAEYADLQIDVIGSEHWEVSDAAANPADLDRAADIGFIDAAASGSGCLGEGRFVVFLPNELHKPSLVNGSCTHVRKLVFKVKM